MASLNLAGKASGYVKLKAPDDSSNNPTVELPTESGELALKSDITGGGGGIPEAPVDGKQYARKDADWSEVEATSGGGDVEAQPPVAFRYEIKSNQSSESSTPKDVKWDVASIDTDSCMNDDGNYVVKKAGLYNFSFNVYLNVNKKKIK